MTTNLSLAVLAANAERADMLYRETFTVSMAGTQIVAGALADWFEHQVELAETHAPDDAAYLRRLNEARDELAEIAVGEDDDTQERHRRVADEYDERPRNREAEGWQRVLS